MSLILFLSCMLLSCEEDKSQGIKMMSWNLQTFFDSQFDGDEYEDFRSEKKGWGEKMYEQRLERLCSVIKELDSDIVIMEELEKEAQIQDIANRLSGNFDFSKLYKYALFARDEKSSIGCAVISRLPIGEVSVHSIDIRLGEKQPAMRPVIQFSILSKNKKLVVFVNHWKSKSGGEDESEIWRRRQEKLLSDLMNESLENCESAIAVGDFNKDISEFDIRLSEMDGKNLVLHGKTSLPVFSPWISEDGGLLEGGSYWYKERWEKIDHFFAAGKTVLSDFRVENSDQWAFDDGHPRKYQIWNGKGFSDHLPITCTVFF